MRFKRDFELVIGIGSQAVIIRPPMRVAFDGQKSISGGLNKLNLAIYNLKESNRLKLVKDKEEQTYLPLLFSVGYAGAIQSIFKGSVHKGANTRQGADHITTIECLDGGFDFINSFTSKTVTGKDNAVNAALEDMPNTGKGKITAQNSLVRPKVLVGNSVKLIEQQLNDGETWYIEDEQLFIIKDGEVTSSFVPLVSAKTGLLNTPERENQKLTFETLLNPSVKIGGQCKIESKTAPHLDGIYKVESLGLKGDNYGSDWKMTATCIKNNNFTVI